MTVTRENPTHLRVTDEDGNTAIFKEARPIDFAGSLDDPNPPSTREAMEMARQENRRRAEEALEKAREGDDIDKAERMSKAIKVKPNNKAGKAHNPFTQTLNLVGSLRGPGVG